MNKAPCVKIFGTDYPTHDGTAIRDYIHVVDLAVAHVEALEHLILTRESTAYNLGTGNGSSVQEVIDMTKRGNYSGRGLRRLIKYSTFWVEASVVVGPRWYRVIVYNASSIVGLPAKFCFFSSSEFGIL